jgi:outer membrane lipoprotein carrier protein
MKRILSIIAVLYFYSFSVSAQNSSDAETVLNNATQKIQSSKGINVSFSLTQKDKFGHSLSASKGILKIKGSKYYIKQQQSETYCNGVQIWNYDGDREVTVTKADDDDNAFSPRQILTGFNKKDFDIKLVSAAGDNCQVQLTPVDKRQNFKYITLYINKSTNIFSKAVIVDKTDAFTEINFTNISLNSTFPDSQFVFDASKHPGVEVINQ